ncbi:hypothetical protein THAOC_18993 [Thalassiosira oceanica]|uniref:B30.2/SPRY domain-containing protein n=1 Tax=Thalassiosira oceanica TaxID=159749 RepID=K0SHX8_THAOC|nr:hypothetical protein THAOC_18993 [Thalassiosira oceanica]|eukprot:EJK60616.1 hypothetical protein THAOC_18993 [Thalassiosira oceanica]
MQTRDNKLVGMLPSATLDTLDTRADERKVRGPPSRPTKIFVNEAAHKRFRQSATEEEESRLPKCGDESDVGLFRALELLRQPLRFDELAGNGFGPQEHPARVSNVGGHWSTAKSGHVMRGGKHFVEFTITSDVSIRTLEVGVMRPVSLTDGIDLLADWNMSVNPIVSSRFKPVVGEKLRSQRTAKWGGSNFHCCAYHSYLGDCFWTDWENFHGASNWQGQVGLGESGTVGLLLDLNEGTLSIFKSGRRLGVLRNRLGGEYVWFVSVCSRCTIGMSRGLVPN